MHHACAHVGMHPCETMSARLGDGGGADRRRGGLHRWSHHGKSDQEKPSFKLSLVDIVKMFFKLFFFRLKLRFLCNY